VYSDASLNPSNLQEGVGGGGVCLVPGDLSGSGKNEIITFSQLFPDLRDINEGEAKMVLELMKWINNSFPSDVLVRIHTDSASILERMESLQKENKWFCNCSPEEELYYMCEGNISVAVGLWEARFRENARCKYCGGRAERGVLSQTTRIQNHVQELMNEIDKRSGIVELVKVPAHKNCYGNNLADMLAKSGRKLEGVRLEIEFSRV